MAAAFSTACTRGATRSKISDLASKAQATRNAVANAASIATRENSAQKAETARVAGLVQTQTQQQNALAAAQVAVTAFQGVMQAGRDAAQKLSTDTVGAKAADAGIKSANASRSAGATVSSSMSSAASRIVGAIWAARPIVQSTTVINSYTQSERGGASSDSRTRRAD